MVLTERLAALDEAFTAIERITRSLDRSGLDYVPIKAGLNSALVELVRLADTYVEYVVGAWHLGAGEREDVKLHEYMGVPYDQYGQWVETGNWLALLKVGDPAL